MSLLMKNVWRSVLRGAVLSRSLRQGSLGVNMSTEVSQSPTLDALMTRMKAAPSTAEVLVAVNANMAHMNHKHLLHALRCLFELQKSQNSETTNQELTTNPTFGVLCEKFNKHARALDVDEAIEATKILSYLKVHPDSVVVQTVLQLIRCYINMINIRQIMFLDFLLTKFDRTNNLVDALKLALPLAFQIHLPLEIDKKDLPLLKDALAYSCNHDLPDRYIDDIVTGLLLHDQAIDARVAISIIWSLCQVNCTEERFPTRMQLLHICYDILMHRIDELSFEEVLTTAAKIKSRIVEKHPEFYHELLLDTIANSVVSRDVGFDKALLVARVMSRIAHTHFGLVGYLCDKAASDPTIISTAHTNTLISFINCLSNNNFIPDRAQWITIQKQIKEHPIVHDENTSLPWTKICLEMASLGLYDKNLLNKVFSKQSINKERKPLDYLQLLTLYEAVRSFHDANFELPKEVLDKAKSVYPVHQKTDMMWEQLAAGLGGPEYIVKNVVLPNGFIADCLIGLHAGYPVEFQVAKGDLRVPIEFLNIPAGGIPICILNFQPGCFSMNSNRLRGTFRLVLDILESQGYAAVAINVSEWLAAPAHERTPYLLREVRYKCGEMGMKLTSG